jgi:hypothetical protein
MSQPFVVLQSACRLQQGLLLKDSSVSTFNLV